MLLSQLIFSSTLLLFIVLIHILYCIVLYYSDLEHFCGFYAIQNKLSNYQIITVWTEYCRDLRIYDLKIRTTTGGDGMPAGR